MQINREPPASRTVHSEPTALAPAGRTPLFPVPTLWPGMKCLLTLPALALVAAPILCGQSAVWTVRSGENLLYLGGAFHLLRADDFPLPAEFDAAFAAADTLCFETDLARMQTVETQQLLLARGMYGENESLKATINDEAWAVLEDYCSDSILPAAHLNRLKPWLVALTISVLELQKLGFVQEGVDIRYHRRAVEAGKSVRGLETYEQQIAFMTGMGRGNESELVLNTINDIEELPLVFEGAVAAWRAGDLKGLEDHLLRDMETGYPELYQEIIVQRNEAWIPELEAMLASEPVEFVLVGAAHLAGRQSVIALLRDRGYAIEQYIAPAP